MLAFAFFRSFLLLGLVLFPLGFGLLRALEKHGDERLGGEFRRLSYAFFLGSFATFFLPLASALFAPRAFAIISMLQAFLGPAIAFFLLRPWRAPARPSNFFLLTSGLLLAVATGALVVLLSGIVPGSITFDYGDAPSWYRAAQNILREASPWEDTWIADYGGLYGIPSRFPLPSIITAWQMAILGFAPYALEAYCLMAGALGLGCIAEEVRELGNTEDSRWSYLCALSPALLLLPASHKLIFFFTHPMLIVMSGLLLILSLRHRRFTIVRLILALGAGLFLLAVHPLALLVLAPLGGAFVLHSLAGSQRHGTVVFYALVLACAAGGILLFSAVAPARFSIFPYLSAESGTWRSSFEPWEMYNLFLSKAALGLTQDLAAVNSQVTRDIFIHPFGFAKFFFSIMALSLGDSFALAVILFLVAFLFSLSHRGRETRWLVATAVFYFLLNQCMVLNFRERHFFPALAILGIPAFAGLLLLLKRGRYLPEIALALSLVFLLHYGVSAAAAGKESRQKMDAGFFNAARFLSGRATSGDQVATNQPKGLAYVLSAPLSGGHFLGMDRNFTEAYLIAKMPHFLVLFGPAAENLKASPSNVPGFSLVLDKPAFPLAIFERN